MVQTTNEFNTLERDLLPLLDHIPEKPSFYINPKDPNLTDLPYISQLKSNVRNIIDFSFIEPL